MLPADIQPTRIVNRGIRKVLPRSLLGRSLLMILLPLVLLQAVALQIFYGSHLDIVSRRLSGGRRRRGRLHAGAAAPISGRGRSRLDSGQGTTASSTWI